PCTTARSAGRTRAISSSIRETGTTCPHGTSMRCTSAEDVAVVELDLRERADAARRDHAEQRDAGAAEHGARHPLDERRYLGQQAEDHEDRARGRRDEARSHARERDELDVLCEGRVR